VQCAEDLDEKNWNGAPGGSGSQGNLRFSEGFFGPLRSQLFFNRCGANSHDEMTGQGAPSVYGDFVSTMFDFDTRNQDFQRVFTDLHKWWIAYADVDGFRLDAAKHVTEDFVAYFSTETRAYANSLGKRNFYLVGEVAAASDWMGRRLGVMFSNPQNPNEHGVVPATLTSRLWDLKDTYLAHPVTKAPGLNAVYDFTESGTARDMLLNHQPTQALEWYFNSDGYRTIAGQADARLNFSILEIHDWPRFTHSVTGDWTKSRVGLGYTLAGPGIPVIYYGQEQGLNGDCHWDNMNAGAANQQLEDMCKGDDHALGRQDMFVAAPFRLGSTVSSIDALAYIGKASRKAPVAWTEDPYLRRDHDVYQTARRFNWMRKSCAPLRFGSTTFRWGEWGNQGLFAFSRIDGEKEMVVVVNDAPYPIAIPRMRIDSGINPSSNVQYKNLLNGFQTAFTAKEGRDSYLDFNGLEIPGNSVFVFARNSDVGSWNSYVGAHMCR
jgi:glycosidase